MRITTMFLAVIALASCTKSNEGESGNGETSLKKRNHSLNNTAVSEELLTLQSDKPAKGRTEDIRNNLFGRFNCDRAEFFIIDNPQNDIYLQRPSSIVLFYLDGALCQTKYVLQRDIGTTLYKELGRCRIVGLDDKNKKIIDAKEMLVRAEGETSINSKLDNYELRWVFGDKEVRYRVERTKEGAKFTYTERLRTYEKQYSLIEKYC